jgi:hypothetical protein
MLGEAASTSSRTPRAFPALTPPLRRRATERNGLDLADFSGATDARTRKSLTDALEAPPQ